MRTLDRAVVTCIAIVTLVAVAAPALAFDLEDYLEAAAEADYAGSQIVVTRWDGDAKVDVIEVEHAGSLTMLQGGKLVSGGAVFGGDTTGAIVVSAWRKYASDRYEAAEPIRVRRLGRDAESVAILEDDGSIRARIVFDAETGAALSTEIFDGSGNVFRLSSMMRFDSTPRRAYAVDKDFDSISDVLLSVDTTTLPGEAAGYRLVDAYTGPDDVVQAFYSDGLFSFSLFQLDGEADEFDDAVEFVVDGGRYRRLATATDVWVSWTADGVDQLLVGDLPPDHLIDVLRELPSPDRPNIFKRMWRGLFG